MVVRADFMACTYSRRSSMKRATLIRATLVNFGFSSDVTIMLPVMLMLLLMLFA